MTSKRVFNGKTYQHYDTGYYKTSTKNYDSGYKTVQDIANEQKKLKKQGYYTRLVKRSYGYDLYYKRK